MAPLEHLLLRDLQPRPALARSMRPELQLWNEGSTESSYGLAIAIPMSGVLGVFGPSCIASAQLAVDEINRSDILHGEQLDPIFLNSDMDCIHQLIAEVGFLLERNAIAGVILMAYSEVRKQLKKVIKGRIPLVYTTPYEGDEFSPNVFTLAPTPYEQFVPGVRRLSEMLGVRRWAMVGKINVRPDPSFGIAYNAIRSAGGSVVFEAHVLPGQLSATAVIDGLIKHKPDIVFSSLAGQDSITFHRMFGEAQLARHMFRFTELTEENILMASGSSNTQKLYTISSYFKTIQSDMNLSLLERYRDMHGPMAPMLNGGGASVYEGIHFCSALMSQRRLDQRGPISHLSGRGGIFHSNQKKEDPIYVAEADQTHFEVIEKLSV